MAKLPEGRSALTDEQMIGLTHRLVDTCIDCKGRIEELETKLAFAIGVLKDMRDDRVCYRHEVHFRRRAAVVVKDLTGGKDE